MPSLPALMAAAVSLAIAARILSPLLAGAAASSRRPPPPACEGYWPDADECLALGDGPSPPPRRRRTASNAGCPQWRMDPTWGKGRDALAARLGDIEQLAREWERLLDEILDRGGETGPCGDVGDPPVRIVRERGVAWSRVEEGVMAGNAEFRAEDGACWTDALRPTYVERFGVKPSGGFQQFVEGFDLGDFRGRLARLVECSEEQGAVEL